MYFLRITGRLTSDRPATNRNLKKSSFKKSNECCNDGMKPLPPWREKFPDRPSFGLDKKLRRKKCKQEQNRLATLQQNYHLPLMRHSSKSIFILYFLTIILKF